MNTSGYATPEHVARSLVRDYGSDITGYDIEDRIDLWTDLGKIPETDEFDFWNFYDFTRLWVGEILEEMGFE